MPAKLNRLPSMIRIIPFLLTLLLQISATLSGQTVTDAEGNVYNTVTIGSQIWMAENLRTTKFADGSDIPLVTTTNTWRYLTTPAYCDYDNLPANSIVYGRLYNAFTLSDVRKICPDGWHVPTDAEWNILTRFLDNTADTTAIGWTGTHAGGLLKETGTTHWASPNTGATNASGFSALPGGYRNLYGTFMYLGNYGYWWSPKTGDTLNIWKRNLNYDESRISRSNNNATYRTSGFCIRCIMDDVFTGADQSYGEMHAEVYPNPAEDKIYIRAEGRDEAEIRIFNLQGKCVLHVQHCLPHVPVYIGSLPSGLYLILTTRGNKMYRNKLIIG